MSDVRVRPYRASDLEACRALWVELVQRHRELYADPSIGGEAPGLHFDRHLERVGAGPVWVAEPGGQVVGMTGLVLEGEEAEIDPLVVAATDRGQGVGRALLEHIVEEARALGVRFLQVRPVARNLDAIHFYYNAGFRRLGFVELFMELEPSPRRRWKPGPELFGLRFEY